MHDAVKPRQVRIMGQINSFGYSWNYAPAVTGFRPSIPNTFGGAPAVSPDYAAAGASCFTCTDPSSGDTQYGVPSSMADQLRSKGYRCRKDECASNTGVQQVQQAAQQNLMPLLQRFGNWSQSYAPPPVATGTYTSDVGYGSLMSGRVPLAGGLGRRALSGTPF